MPFIEVELSSTAIIANEIEEWSKGIVKKLGLPVALTHELMNLRYPNGKKHTVFVTGLFTDPVGYRVTVGTPKIILFSNCEQDAEATAFFLSTSDNYQAPRSSAGSNKPSLVSPDHPFMLPLLEIIKKDKAYLPPDPVEDGFYVDKDIWYFLVWSYKEKNQVLLKGDTGTGKTTLPGILMTKVNKVNKRFDFAEEDYSIYDMQMSNPESELKGSPAVLDGKTYFKYSRFSQNIQKPGLSLLNEINRGSKMVQNILLSLLDDQKTLFIERAEEIQKIPVHPEHTFWATANIGVKFTGTTQLDVAFVRRFDIVELVTPPESKRISVLLKKYHLFKNDAERIVKFSERVASANLSKTISIAEELKIAQKVSGGFNLIKAIEHTVLHSFSGGVNGEQAQVLALIQSC